MKLFVIFPTICVFLLTTTVFTWSGQTNRRTTLLWSAMLTALFGGIMTWLSIEAFAFLYYSGFFGVLVCIPCLTYLTNQLLRKNTDKINWTRIAVYGILSTLLTIATAGILIFMSFMYNPTCLPVN